jgi:capsular exopolysaccharide synthesis family protein
VITIGTDSSGQQDIRAYLRIFWRWKLLFLAIVVALPFAVYLVERGKPRTYESSTLIELQDVSVSLGTTSAPVQTGNVQAIARLVTTTPVAKVAAGLMHPPGDPGTIVGDVSASGSTDTGFITIVAQGPSPRYAAAVANAFAGALGIHQAQEAARELRQQIRGQVAQLKVTKGFVARQAIFTQISQLQGLLDSVSSGAQVIQPALPNPTSISPHVRRSVELALVIAILLGMGAVVLAESSDRRLRTPGDLERLTGWPLLGVIPDGAFAPDHQPTPGEEEAFQMLRASMTYFNVEHPPASVAVISPLVEDGKTTVAVGLAVASARAGMRTVLVDADLRRPQVSERLGMPPPTGGLADVLAGEATLDEALVERVIDVPDGGELSVLAAGPPPSNPTPLLASRGMELAVRELERQSDLVVIDTAAALAVSDALPLIQSAAGVVLVVRMNRSSRAAVRRINKVIAAAQGTVLGVVATGSRVAAAGYGEYYGKRGNRWMRLRRRRSNYYARYVTPNGTPARNGSAPQSTTGAGDEETARVTDD